MIYPLFESSLPCKKDCCTPFNSIRSANDMELQCASLLRSHLSNLLHDETVKSEMRALEITLKGPIVLSRLSRLSGAGRKSPYSYTAIMGRTNRGFCVPFIPAPSSQRYSALPMLYLTMLLLLLSLYRIMKYTISTQDNRSAPTFTVVIRLPLLACFLPVA
jgi:hypothetical protein